MLSGKHQSKLQILVIPDDKAEPKTFALSRKQLKLLKIVGSILVLHLVVGIFAYYQVGSLFFKNRELSAANRQLEENNVKVFELLEAFEELESSQTKIRSALGLGRMNNSDGSPVAEEESPDIIPDVITSYPSVPNSMASDPKNVSNKLGFLQQNQSGLHTYLPNVPTLLPVEGVLTSKFGDVNSVDSALHRGIDIAAPRGTFIRAAADGIVVFAGWTYNLGELLILYHEGGFFTYYGHNQEILVTRRNSWVKKGDPIATLGNSGESSAPHLHFEIWKDGIPLNPNDYILALSDIK